MSKTSRPPHNPCFAEMWNEARFDIDDQAEFDAAEVQRLLGHWHRRMFFAGVEFVLDCLEAGIDADTVRTEIKCLKDQEAVWYSPRKRARVEKSGVPTVWPPRKSVSSSEPV